MNLRDFSKENKIAKSSLYQWNKKFNQEKKDIEFAPITLKNAPDEEQIGVIQLNIECPNHIRLSISIPEYRLVSFIQEIAYATSTIW